MWAKLASLQDLSWCWSMPDPKSRLVPPIALFGLDISNSCNGFIGKVTHFNLCRTYMIYYIIYICESSPFCKESSWFEASGCGTSARPHIHIAPAKEKIENEDQHDQNQNHRYPQTSTDLRSSKLFKVVQCTHKGNRLAQREHDLIQALVVMVDHQGLASIGI